MNARARRDAAGSRGSFDAATGNVYALDRLRIERALVRRERYKYVHPRVEPEGHGWKIVSPNCSRTVDPSGGDIDIAWFAPTLGGRWQLHSRDHANHCWVMRQDDLLLDEALERICVDAHREFWQ